MKRLFLASSGLSALPQYIGEDPETLSLLFIPTAGNLDDDTWWIQKDREVLHAMGFNIYDLDIAQTPLADMNEQLMTSDIVYIAGGNSFYLLQQLQKTGFGKLLQDYVNNGGFYAGASAGALVAGGDIGPAATLDEPDKVFNLKSTLGLHFVDIIPMPHYNGNPLSEIGLIKATHVGVFDMVLMTDDQAIIVDGNNWELIDSPRSTVELEWIASNT
ncbi:Type 1 glutamine amidotransferase-like domain-containing protein [Candidatus Saccharibacteria bacterium]|nr:Type 1 glutamine amidotransferase-like domain-containing protein [Candidatus Saccharibacteria bacterium]